MKKAVIIIIILAVIGGGAGYLMMRGDDQDNQQTTPPPAAQQDSDQDATQPAEGEEAPDTEGTNVTIESFDFTPASITIKKGTTVTWTNKDSVAHTVTPDEDGAFEGSSMIAQNETFSYTFDEVGTYPYHCQPHPNMKGTVTVTE